MYDLSILIPARNEQFLARTVEDLLKNKRGKTEILVGLDGEWADPPIEDHPDVRIVYYSESIGQRAMTNALCRLSKAKYVMKCDAHTAWDEGFDVKLMEDMQEDFTMVPIMKNLHAFDWLCISCAHRIYQGPTPKECPNCKGKMEKDILWKAKESPKSTSFRFDKTLHFQYFGEYKSVQDATGSHLVESMSLQGSCFMLTRKKYWELNICDEAHGSWGQQGVEVALKTWLSGGRVIVNKKTWYAHMFRTQGGDFGFPYPLSGNQVERARQFSRDLWLNNRWEKAIHPLSWLIEKFAPVPDWEYYGKESKGIIYYTDNKLNLKIAHAVQKQLGKMRLPIVSASLKPMTFGENIHLPYERGHLTMFKQILAALERSKADIIFFCEHDVLYHPSHFDFTPIDKKTFYYNINVVKADIETGKTVKVDVCRQVSGICVYREAALKHYRERVAYVEKNGFDRNLGFEPGTHKRVQWINEFKAANWSSPYPNIDVRHDRNLTPNRWSPDQFRNKDNAKGWTEGHISELDGWKVNGEGPWIQSVLDMKQQSSLYLIAI